MHLDSSRLYILAWMKTGCAADIYNHNITDLKSAVGQGGKVLRGELAMTRRGKSVGGLNGEKRSVEREFKVYKRGTWECV